MSKNNVVGLKLYQFVHVLDVTTNITRIEIGPQTIVLKTNESFVAGPLPMIVIAPGYYCVVHNPVSNYVPGQACEIRFGEKAVHFHEDPFPLYPGEVLEGASDYLTGGLPDYKRAIKKLPVVPDNHGIKLKALLDCEDENGKHQAGEEWQLNGPRTYIPRPEVEVQGIVNPTVLKEGEALRLRAKQGFIDRYDNERVTDEEWFICEQGSYLPDVYEEVVELLKKITLTPEIGLNLRATQTVKDRYGITRLAGEEWLLTSETTDEYYPEIGVEVASKAKKLVLTKGQYCVVENPLDKSGRPQLGKLELRIGCSSFFLHPGKLKLGKLELRIGCSSFFLHPGERLQGGNVKSSYVLSDQQAIVLQAVNQFKDTMFKGKNRLPGDTWMIRGPIDYIPPVEVQVVKQRDQIPLSKNEGIYIQNKQTGKVRAIMGPKSYMLTAHEELWEKKLDSNIETLLKQGGGDGSGDIRKIAYFEQSIDPQMLKGRDKTRVITYRCPGNTAVQVYNYLEKTARVVFGPDLVILGPHENFNVLSLSAGKPKKCDAMRSLCLMLGPDFITDIIEVETSDHARLRLQLAFNNHFEYEKGDVESEAKIFSVGDFIGFACRKIGGRIRAQVAHVPFDEFHKHSAMIIQTAVFGVDQEGNLNIPLTFEANNLVISSVDIQSIEPVDAKMRDSLSKSVQLAIEISTKSIEASASHEASRNEQIAKGQLERQKLLNEMDSEKEKTKLLELQAITAAVESTGQAKAESQAQAERMLIECESEIESAKLKAEAEEIEHLAKLETQGLLRAQELSYQRELNRMELDLEKGRADIEVNKFKSMVETLGRKTIETMSIAGPKAQTNLLKGLGLQSVLVTDGTTPINLFDTAHGLIGSKGGQ
ncbi:MVP [Mytilus coruscus]|uniref:Major vault protein n=1 Tax=Mytilus coruscus TaxID=42192 RepID=A0A6J8ENE0_MYTCO|nr:MVP [Mytilus coruscus]